jgi:hypothetical protein
MVYPCDFLALHLEITGTSASGFKMLVEDQQVDLSGIVCVCVCVIYLFCGATAPSGPEPPQYRGYTITLRHTTLGRTPVDE